MILIPKSTLANDVMCKKFITKMETQSINDCIESMLEKNLKEVFVCTKDNVLKSIISLTDISYIKSKNIDLNKSVGDYMKNKKILTIDKNISLVECRNIMIKNKIGRLPVVENQKIIGVIREEEIRDYFYMQMEQLGIKLNHIINNIHEAICIVDVDGKVIIWNKNSEQLYGVKSSEIIGRPLDEFFPDAILLSILNSKEPIKDKYHSPRKNSHVIVSAQPIFISGEFVGAVSTDRDISEVKKLSSRLEKANTTLKFLEEEVKKFSNDNFENIIGKSEKLAKTIDIARQVSKTRASILVLGESGTGKEVFSRAIHDYSKREGLFVPVNCSAIPNELFESEFFGYEGGAFTGANRKGKMGIFELANKGTVFLDEIADLPLHMQAKLLRVLQENEIRRVGSEHTTKINVRIISATNKDLKTMIRQEKFREDLYYRLNVVEINLPPLRERRGDIALLINSFLKELCEKNNKVIPVIESDVMHTLESYEWKGNIRELKNTIEHLVVLSRDDVIRYDLVPSYIKDKEIKNKNNHEYPLDLNEAIKKMEIYTIHRALEISNNNKSKAAKILNIPRSTLYYKLELYNIK